MAKKSQYPQRPYGGPTTNPKTGKPYDRSTILKKTKVERVDRQNRAENARLFAANSPRANRPAANEIGKEYRGVGGPYPKPFKDSREVIGSRADERRGRYSAVDEAVQPFVGRDVIPRGTPRGAVRDEQVGVRNVFKSLGDDQNCADAFVARLTGRSV